MFSCGLGADGGTPASDHELRTSLMGFFSTAGFKSPFQVLNPVLSCEAEF